MRRRQTSIPSPTAPFDFAPHQVTLSKSGSFSPAGYKVEITTDAGVVERNLAVTGRPLEIKVVPRAGNSSCSSCTVRTHFKIYLGCIPGTVKLTNLSRNNTL